MRSSGKYLLVTEEANESLKKLQEKLQSAAAILTSNSKVVELLLPFLGPSPYGSLRLLFPETINKYFAQGNLNKMTDIVINTASNLYEFGIVGEIGIDKERVLEKTYEILNLAIESTAFAGRRHPYRFYNHETNIERIQKLKNYITNKESRCLAQEERKKDFFK